MKNPFSKPLNHLRTASVLADPRLSSCRFTFGFTGCMDFSWITRMPHLLFPAMRQFDICWETVSVRHLESVMMNICLIPLTRQDIIVYVPNDCFLSDGPAICLSDISDSMEFTWLKEKPYLLCAVIKQIMAICWAIAFVRQLESVLKNKWLMPLTEHLSIQDFIDRIPKRRLRSDGAAISLREVGFYLQKFGVLLESECRLASPERIFGVINRRDKRLRRCPKTVEVHSLRVYLYKYKEDAFKGYGIFHSRLQTLIKESGLVSVNFLSYESYWQEKGKGIFFPTEEEMNSPLPTCGHVILAAGSSHDENGNLYYLCQESGGTEFGFDGYSRVYANLINAYVEMSGTTLWLCLYLVEWLLLLPLIIL